MKTFVLASSWPWNTAEDARRIEDLGFTGMVMTDTQNMRGEVIVAMTVAALATKKLLIGSGVTNPHTRHPAVLASAFASLQKLSEGRMVLGIGRGDSALAYVGLAPASPTTLFRFVEALQIYLRGEGVPFDLLPDSNIARMDSLGLAESPEYSELKWLQLDVPKVPVEVSASGPKVIAGAAILADTLNLAVGADPNRVRWGIELAKTSRGQAGLPADGLSYGAWINVVVSDDPNEARRIGGGRLAGAIRFGAMHGTANGPVSDSDRKVIESVPRAYAMSHHGESGTNADQQIPDEFAHKFGVFGPANYCVERLLELKELGLDSFVLIPPGADTDPDGVQLRIIADEVVSRF